MLKDLLVLAIAIGGSTLHAATGLDTWIAQKENVFIEKMMANVSPPSASLGSIVASPEVNNPPYFFHWQRDSAITIDTIISLYQSTKKPAYRTQINEFAKFSRRLQQTWSSGGLGEPKYHVDGTPFAGDWCRPQNDGPALRAIVLIRFARLLLNEGDGKYVKTFFYDSHLPTDSIIKADLEFISHNWRVKNCDLWEEVTGDHFYTRMVQRRALLDGAKFAEQLNDPLAAEWYRLQARALEFEIAKHWDANRGIYVPTLNRTQGVDYKHSGLDASVILAVLHGDNGDGFFKYTDPRLLGTFQKLVDRFQAIYLLNQRSEELGTAIGRYPEDKYAGTNFNGGNPWVLLTAAFAKYAYLVAGELKNQGKTEQAQMFLNNGDRFLMRIQAHAHADGSLAEQMDKNSGYMTSARDLTWSYVEILQAIWQRKSVVKSAIKTGTFATAQEKAIDVTRIR